MRGDLSKNLPALPAHARMSIVRLARNSRPQHPPIINATSPFWFQLATERSVACGENLQHRNNQGSPHANAEVTAGSCAYPRLVRYRTPRLHAALSRIALRSSCKAAYADRASMRGSRSQFVRCARFRRVESSGRIAGLSGLNQAQPGLRHVQPRALFRFTAGGPCDALALRGIRAIFVVLAHAALPELVFRTIIARRAGCSGKRTTIFHKCREKKVPTATGRRDQGRCLGSV
jgi:hypothetical protein